MQTLSSFAVVVMVLAPQATHAQTVEVLPKIVVLDLVSERGIDEGVIRLLNELLLTEFNRHRRYQVIGGSDIKTMLESEAQRELAGCADSACFAQIGGALGAEFLASSSIGRVGDFYLINVKILNVETGQVVHRWSEQVEGIENELMLAVRNSVASVHGFPDEASVEHSAPGVSPPQVEAGSDGGIGVAPILLWSGGGVGLGAALIFGLVARTKSKESSLPGKTQAEASKAYDASKTAATVSNIGFGLGAASAIAGLIVFLVADGDESASVPPVALSGLGNGRGLSLVVAF